MTATPRVDTPLARRRGKTPEQRLGMDVLRGAPDECWPWVGCRDRWGYGKVHTSTGHVLMHRVAYEMEHGPLAPGAVVRHSCDNPPCCNPAHLSDGTHRANRQDCVARDRQARGERIGAHRLTETAVRDARRRYWGNGERAAALADEYGVTQAAMHRALNGETWSHVTETGRCVQ